MKLMKDNTKSITLILNTILFVYIASKIDFENMDVMGSALFFLVSFIYLLILIRRE
jgi:NhaP-type Na+/H+ or K+/H+ antiporter